ncbi:uncharacterized protein LOC135228463 [Loxodonta africana]|uniref:uncharacterized protein LOC135228463 n=1 Tax=Loxodonta africana TaxID=9785 RepID=UPI0030D25FD2
MCDHCPTAESPGTSHSPPPPPPTLARNWWWGRLQPDPAYPDYPRPSGPERAPALAPRAAHSPLVNGSIFPPPRLLAPGAPKLPTLRAEAALLTEHAQRGRRGLPGRCREGQRRSTKPPLRVFAAAAEKDSEA